MDIHRCRFVPYQPSSINALAFSHTSNPKQKTPIDLRLALGRENGDIEIWNPRHGQWAQERMFRGGVGRTIEQLLWTQDITIEEDEDREQKTQHGPLRLFSSGGASSVTEWDIEKGIPKRHADGNKGDIWCIAAQPQWTNAQQKEKMEEMKKAPAQMIAAGCSDGSIVLFQTAEDDLQYDRVLVQPLVKKSKVISIAWRDRDTIVAGYEESTIRVIDVRSRRVLRNITLGKSSEGEAAVVWTVRCLPNGTILSGDSTGELKIWDAQNYSLVQRLKTHSADILDITVNASGTKILTCGVDRRTVAYASSSNVSGSRTQRWHEVRHRRFHEHDVKTITSFESKDLSVAVSGGMDTVPVIIPLQNVDEEYHRSLPYLPQKPQMSVSPTTRLMLTWWGRDLFLWNLPARRIEPYETESVPEDQLSHKLLAQIQLKEDEYLTSAEIARSGDMVIAATNTTVKLFQVRKTSRNGDAEVRYRSLDIPGMIANQGSSTVGFSPDCKWLYAVRLNNVITLARILPAPSAKERRTVLGEVIKLDRKTRKSSASTNPKLGKYANHINAVAFSSDSRVLAIGDLSGSIDTWVLANQEFKAAPTEDNEVKSDSDSDSDDETTSVSIRGQRWIRIPGNSQLPRLDSAILVLSFKPASAAAHPANSKVDEQKNQSPNTSYLVAITSSHQVVQFDVEQCRISDYSRRNPSSLFPHSFRQIKDRVMGAWWDCTTARERLWMYGEGFVYMIDLSQDFDPTKDNIKLEKRIVGMLGNHTVEAPQGHALTRFDGGNEAEHGTLSRKRKRKSGGAGDEMRQGQRYDVKFRKLESNADEAGLLSPPESVAEDADMLDLEEGLDHGNDALVVSRRKAKQKQMLQGNTGQQEIITADEQDESEAGENDGAFLQNEEDVVSKPASWHTFQYRGIFGACVLLQDDEEESEAGLETRGIGPEVVIVERPMHDIELVPRFTNGQEWY